MKAVLIYSRKTRSYALYAVSGGFNKWYVPLDWYKANSEPATITIELADAPGEQKAVYERATPQFFVYKAEGHFNQWYLDKQDGLPKELGVTITPGGRPKNPRRRSA